MNFQMQKTTFHLLFGKIGCLPILLTILSLPALAQNPANLVQSLNRAAIGISSENLLENNGDPGELRKKIDFGNFKVLGLGEQSHGTAEFFKARTTLITLLAVRHPVIKIGLEAPMAETERLNEFLTGNSGNLTEILKSFRLYNYECDEFVALVNAVKAINLNRKNKVLFFGFDVQSPYGALDNMLSFSVEDGLNNTDSLKQLVNYYRMLDGQVYSHSFEANDFGDLEKLSEYVIAAYETTNKNLASQSVLLNKSIENYRQFLFFNNPYNSRQDMHLMSTIRDSLMAANVLKEVTGNGKIVLLAHNAHVQKTANTYSKSMGQFLFQKLGDAYKTLGMSTATGFYTAFNQQDGKIVNSNIVIKPDADAFEYYFSKTANPVFFLTTALVKLKGNEKLPARYRLLPFSYTDQQFVAGNIFVDFDFVLHINTTSGNKSFYLK